MNKRLLFCKKSHHTVRTYLVLHPSSDSESFENELLISSALLTMFLELVKFIDISLDEPPLSKYRVK